MNTKKANARHAADEAPHANLQRRIGAAFVSGCLALSMCPALAFAQPGEADTQQNAPDGNPPAAQPGGPQGGFQNGPQGQMGGDLDSQIRDILGPYTSSQGNGQPSEAPSGDASQQPPEMPSGDASQQPPEAPNGDSSQQPPEMPSGDASQQPPEMPSGDSSDGSAPGSPFSDNGQQPGEPPSGNIEDNGAPAIPDGEVNVQQIIDAIRAMLAKANFVMPGAGTTEADATQAGSQAPAGAPDMNGEPPADAPEMNGEPPADAPALPDGATSPGSNADQDVPSYEELVQMVMDLVNQILGTTKASA